MKGRNSHCTLTPGFLDDSLGKRGCQRQVLQQQEPAALGLTWPQPIAVTVENSLPITVRGRY